MIKIETGFTDYPFDGEPSWKEDSEPLYIQPAAIKQMRWSEESPQSYTSVYTDFGVFYTTMKPEEIFKTIAATDPQTVRALIDEVERLEKLLDGQVKYLRRTAVLIEGRNPPNSRIVEDLAKPLRVASYKLEQALKGTGHE